MSWLLLVCVIFWSDGCFFMEYNYASHRVIESSNICAFLSDADYCVISLSLSPSLSLSRSYRALFTYEGSTDNLTLVSSGGTLPYFYDLKYACLCILHVYAYCMYSFQSRAFNLQAISSMKLETLVHSQMIISSIKLPRNWTKASASTCYESFIFSLLQLISLLESYTESKH